MHRADSSPPIPAFTAPHGRSAAVEILIPVDPERTLLPGDLEDVLEDVVERVDRALDRAFVGCHGSVRVDHIGIVDPIHTPFFPVALGGQAYEDITDVAEAIDDLRTGTSLDGLAFDAAGRAFTCTVWVSFRREAIQDRAVSEVWTLEGRREA